MTVWGRQTRHEIQIVCVSRHLVVRRGIMVIFYLTTCSYFHKNSTGHVLFLDIGTAQTWIQIPSSRFRKHSLLSILLNIIEGWIEYYSEGDRTPTISIRMYTYILKSSSACKTGLSAFPFVTFRVVLVLQGDATLLKYFVCVLCSVLGTVAKSSYKTPETWIVMLCYVIH